MYRQILSWVAKLKRDMGFLGKVNALAGLKLVCMIRGLSV